MKVLRLKCRKWIITCVLNCDTIDNYIAVADLKKKGQISRHISQGQDKIITCGLSTVQIILIMLLILFLKQTILLYIKNNNII